MDPQYRLPTAACILGALLCSPVQAAAEPDSTRPVQTVWQPVEIKYSYMAFTTAYSCDAFETKLENILKVLGSPPQTKVRANCPDLSRPARNFFVTITTATPVPAAEAKLNKSEQELLERLGSKHRLSTEPFAASWQTIDLSRERRLDLQPGDCELMEGLRDRVLPKLSVKVVSDRVLCTPKQVSTRTPELIVSALVALPAPDQPAADTRTR